MKKLLIFLILFAILFISSGQTYEEQTLLPALEKYLPFKPFESLLSFIHIPYWGTIVSIEERGYYAFIEFLLRKAAHFFIFGAIALAIINLLPKIGARLAFAITVAIALFDEYHQSLTGGRTPTAEDVLLDAFGAAVALGIWKLLIAEKHKKEREKPGIVSE